MLFGQLSIDNWLTIIAMAGTALLVAGGWIWWLSATYMQIKGIRKDFAEFASASTHDRSRLWDRSDKHSEKLQNHEVRIVKVEGRLGVSE